MKQSSAMRLRGLSSYRDKTLLLSAVILLISFSTSSRLFATPLSLKECYARAVTHRLTLKQRAADIEAAEARYKQAIAELYPLISLVGNQRYRNSPDFGSLSRGAFSDPSTGLPRTRTLGTSQFEALVTVSQPLFRGFRELALSRASEAEQAALSHQLLREQELLYLDIAELFYQTHLYHEQELALQKGARTLQSRVAELGNFIKLGKSRESERHVAEGDLAQQALQIERLRKSKEATRAALASLLQLPISELAIDNTAHYQQPPPIDQSLAKLKERQDIRAKTESQRVIEELITAEERNWWPALNLDLTTIPYEDPNRNRDWEVLLRLNMPVFDGGRISARIAEQQARLLRVKAETAEQTRLAEQEIRVAYTDLEHAQRAHAQAEKLQSARAKSYQSLVADYANGQVTNLDVLNALSQLQRAELDVIETKYTIGNDIARVFVYAGEVP